MTDAGSPNNLALGITARCNYNCVFCILGEARALFADADILSVRRILRSERKRFGSVSFTGGEPTLRTELPRLAIYAKRLGYRVQISSNGGMFAYEDYCREFGRRSVDTYLISLSAMTAASYEAATRTKGSFQNALKGIGNLLSFGQQVVTNTVIHKGNYRSLPSIARGLAALGHGRCRFTFPMYTVDPPPANALCHIRKKDVPAALRSLRTAIDILADKGAVVKVALLPFCQLRGYEEYVEPFKDDVALYVRAGKAPAYMDMCDQVRFQKDPVCRGCRFGGVCRGIESTSPFAPKKQGRSHG